MVKLRAGKKKQTAVTDSGVVSAEFKKVRHLPRIGSLIPPVILARIRTKKGATILLASVVVLALIIVGAVLLVKKLNQPPVVQLQSEGQYVSNKINDLEQNPLPSSASQSEKIKYYESLEIHYELAEDYENAVVAFQERFNVQSGDLDYLDYARLARYYIKLNRNENAIAAIDKAIALLPPTANEETGYNPTIARNSLLQMKEGL